jgi:hypothetical protein
MVCSARFSCRCPPRLSRSRTSWPEEAGIGATPPSMAKAASERSRPGCDQLISGWAAATGLPAWALGQVEAEPGAVGSRARDRHGQDRRPHQHQMQRHQDPEAVLRRPSHVGRPTGGRCRPGPRDRPSKNPSTSLPLGRRHRSSARAYGDGPSCQPPQVPWAKRPLLKGDAPAGSGEQLTKQVRARGPPRPLLQPQPRQQPGPVHRRIATVWNAVSRPPRGSGAAHDDRQEPFSDTVPTWAR